MDLHDYIEAGICAKGSVSALAEHLGINPNSVTDAKAHRRGLPADACVKLCDLLGVELRSVIAASALATERKAEKRAFWLPFVQNPAGMRRIAGIALILTFVTNFVTPSPTEAAPALNTEVRQFVLW